jgi:transposase-like protein
MNAFEKQTRHRSKTQYPDVFKAQALIKVEANEGNVSKTARELGIPKDTLYDWVNSRGINPDVLEIQAGVKGPMADEFERASRLYLQRAVKPEAIEKTSGYYALLGAGDAMKSAQLLRGQPTSITESVERQELVVILQTALEQVIDVTPEPTLKSQT